MVRVRFGNFYMRRRRGIPDYRFPDFPTGYSRVAKSEKHVQSGRADLLVYDHMIDKRRRRRLLKGQLPYKPKFRDFFQEWNRNKAQNVFVKFVKYNLEEKEVDYAFHDKRPSVEKMRSPAAYKAREKKIKKLAATPKDDVIELISGFINNPARKKREVPKREESVTYVGRRKAYEKLDSEKKAQALKRQLGLPAEQGKPGEKYAIPDEVVEKYDPDKEYDGLGVYNDEKFFFPNHFVESLALKVQVPVVAGNKGKKWLKSKMIFEGKPGGMGKAELVYRTEDRGNLRSRYNKERYENKDGHFGFTKHGVPVKHLDGPHKVFNFKRIDFDRLEGPEGTTLDVQEGVFHEKTDKMPKKEWKRSSIHSIGSPDDEDSKFTKKFIQDVKKSGRAITGIKTLGDWYIPSGAPGYRPGFLKELDLDGSDSSSSSEEVPPPIYDLPPPPPPPPKPKSKPKSKRPPPPRSLNSLPFSDVSSVASGKAKYRPPRPRPDPNSMDFVFRNALRVARTPARKPPCTYIDDKKGSRHDYCTSGLAMIHVLRQDYGRVPEYLQKRNIELGRPPVPNWRKFYQPHDCKYYHRHVHCKGCNRVLPVDKYGGPKMYVCDFQEKFGPCPCPEIDTAIYQSCYPQNSRVKRC